MLWRWRYGGADRSPASSCIIPIVVSSTRRSRSANASKRSASRSLDGKDRNRFGQRYGRELIATLKTELLVHRRRFPDREVARSAIFEYLEGFYNRRRLHSALSYRSPADYKEATMEGAAMA
jgi:transposase InsO family protein